MGTKLGSSVKATNALKHRQISPVSGPTTTFSSFEIVSLYSSCYSETHYADWASTELSVICLFLPPECWIYRCVPPFPLDHNILHRNLKKNPKVHIEPQKSLYSQSIPELNIAGGITIPDFRICYQAIVMKESSLIAA